MVWAYVRMADRTVSLQRSVVIFAISQGAVSFDRFARLFRDGQKCLNALLLDWGQCFELIRADAQSPQQCRAARPLRLYSKQIEAHLGNN